MDLTERYDDVTAKMDELRAKLEETNEVIKESFKQGAAAEQIALYYEKYGEN